MIWQFFLDPGIENFADALSSSNSVLCHIRGKAKVWGNCPRPQRRTAPAVSYAVNIEFDSTLTGHDLDFCPGILSMDKRTVYNLY